VGAAILVLGVGAYFDRLSSLDEEFSALQKRAVRLEQSAPTDTGTASEVFKARFWQSGPLPEPLVFASTVQETLSGAGLHVTESRVLPVLPGSSWVEFQADGDIEEWFRFLRDLRSRDPKTLFRSLSLVHRAGALYTIAFEVGHVVLP
jgi:hypothetical protein